MRNFRTALLVIFTMAGLSFAKSTYAAYPGFNGHVYYMNSDGTKTTRGVPNIYIQWSDKDGHRRFTKTDSNGEYTFERYYEGPNAEERHKKAYRTWIKPLEPEVPPVYEPDKDLSSQGYERMISVDLYEWGLSCSTNPHTITLMQPRNRTGEWIEAESHWINDDGNAITASKVINPVTVGNINFNNGEDRGMKAFVANFYYKPVIIAGRIVDSSNHKPLPNTRVNIYTDKGVSKEAITDGEGRFSLPEFISKDQLYAVRIDNPPSGYQRPSETITDGWTQRFTHSSDPADPANTNTPVGSPSYELQKYGTNDCSGPAGTDISRIGRCNFQLDPLPSYPLPSGISNPSFSSAAPLPSGVTYDCLNLPVSGSVAGISIDNATENNTGFFPLTLQGFPGQGSYLVSVVINYSNNACRIFNLRFNYNARLLTSPSPGPESCLIASGKPDGCSCTMNTECLGGQCSLERGSICFTKAFIQTQGGDVHSNTRIEQ